MPSAVATGAMPDGRSPGFLTHPSTTPCLQFPEASPAATQDTPMAVVGTDGTHARSLKQLPGT